MTAVDPLQLSRTAMHEACHGVVALCQGVKVDLLSTRPGEGFRGVTLFEPDGAKLPWLDLDFNVAAPSQPPAAREAFEKDIIISLAGASSAYMLEPLTGHVAPDHDEEAITAAVQSLERLEPALSCRLLAAEAAPDDPDSYDAANAQRAAWHLNSFDDRLAASHLFYLRAVADELVVRHRQAIRAVALALREKTVLTGAEVETIVRSFLCLCHPRPSTPEKGETK